MIEFKCANCGKKFTVKDDFAGKAAKCNNCGSAIKIPVPVGSEVASFAAPPTPSATASAPPGGIPPIPQAPTVVVQLQQPMAAPGTIGPANVSVVLAAVLALFTNCFQYFYLGQTGKGVLFLLLDLFFWAPVILFSCGIGLIGYLPYHLVLLIDSIVVASRLKTQAISPWRFF